MSEFCASHYVAKIEQKCSALDYVLSFMDRTVICTARPGHSLHKKASYNGHKRKQDLKFQTVNTSDGISLHMFGTLEGCRQHWEIYVRNEIEHKLQAVGLVYVSCTVYMPMVVMFVAL